MLEFTGGSLATVGEGLLFVAIVETDNGRVSFLQPVNVISAPDQYIVLEE